MVNFPILTTLNDNQKLSCVELPCELLFMVLFLVSVSKLSVRGNFLSKYVRILYLTSRELLSVDIFLGELFLVNFSISNIFL
jgi:hypothetical protein